MQRLSEQQFYWSTTGYAKQSRVINLEFVLTCMPRPWIHPVTGGTELQKKPLRPAGHLWFWNVVGTVLSGDQLG